MVALAKAIDVTQMGDEPTLISVIVKGNSATASSGPDINEFKRIHGR